MMIDHHSGWFFKPLAGSMLVPSTNSCPNSKTWNAFAPVDYHNTTSRYGGVPKWGYPQIIHFHGIFHYKPSILWYPPWLWNPICLKLQSSIARGDSNGSNDFSERVRRAIEEESPELDFVDAWPSFHHWNHLEKMMKRAWAVGTRGPRGPCRFLTS